MRDFVCNREPLPPDAVMAIYSDDKAPGPIRPDLARLSRRQSSRFDRQPECASNALEVDRRAPLKAFNQRPNTRAKLTPLRAFWNDLYH
ncbi:hypothetical protein BV98_000002 [Sphingobium herbicidovorans NBRC 16415]|uniref:Uncharacterized protein n=1 Tax=Sphingobium herbicidovorans (strain ATCC 700291 / DSM 11019 / CCUG 56400 / KCTC 2939 / LMG 18315 / NBRC 16415 / MH) TaxID=1219045 RepID=A0A086PED7_SPHHM|nr:hypothetical protein BV98_000002 [Sphingobium herbicidovorans NBRC 16415]